MENDYIEKKYKNFQNTEWDFKDNTLILKEDLDVILKLENKRLRSDDTILSCSEYNPIFNQYNIDAIVTLVAYYKKNIVDLSGVTFLYVDDTLIPFPVAGNMTTIFYKNEYNIAKLFSLKNNKSTEFNNLTQKCNCI